MSSMFSDTVYRLSIWGFQTGGAPNLPGDRRRGAPGLASTGLGQRGVGICCRCGAGAHGGGPGDTRMVPDGPGGENWNSSWWMVV